MHYILANPSVHAMNGVHRHSWILIPVGAWMWVGLEVLPSTQSSNNIF